MITNEAMTASEYVTDTELVSRTLSGDRDAFDRIVSRYQILICSLAYSHIGHLGQSEDVAQETFITAWKHLRLLRQPEKLRGWLCGIVRNRAKKCLRYEFHQPVYHAESLETAADLASTDSLPSDQTITAEEEALLWRALERIPELYREPLILFYREHQSIESVAAEMDLTEDAVKQRLARGRKLLHEEVESFVENTLRKTAPTPAFSSAVLAALPIAGGSAATAGAGVAGKSAVTVKSSFLMACLLPFVGIFTGFGAQWLMFQGNTGRAMKFRLIVTWVVVLTVAIGGQAIVQACGQHFAWSNPVFFTAMAGFWWFYAMIMATWIVTIYRHTQEHAAAGVMVPPTRKPMTPITYAAIVAGTHLMMFWCIIHLAWQAHDHLGVAVFVGLMSALGVWNFFKYRDRVAHGMGPVYIVQLASCAAVILAAFNLRFDNWIAYGFGVSVAEIHQRLPLWIVPALTLMLVVWTILMLALTKPKAPDSRPTQG